MILDGELIDGSNRLASEVELLSSIVCEFAVGESQAMGTLTASFCRPASVSALTAGVGAEEESHIGKSNT